jgi:hypothetical protein
MVIVENAVSAAFQELAEPQLADSQGLIPHVHAVIHEKVEGVQPHLGIALSAVQSLEFGDPISTEYHSLAIDDERGFAQPQRGLNYQRVAIGPVIAARRVNSRTRLPSRWTIRR